MRVLVVESDRHAADAAAIDLQAAGHHVLRCHEDDLPAFPCNALCDKGTCPIEDDASVDVVLDYRTRPYPRPTAFEDGVSCALRHHIPLVVAGTSALNPFDKWTTAISTSDDRIVETCEHAARQPIERLAAPARAEVRRRLAARAGAAEAVDVVVRRSQGGQLDAIVHIPQETDEIDDALAVAVAGVLRAESRHATRVNVAVERNVGGALVASGPSSLAE